MRLVCPWLRSTDLGPFGAILTFFEVAGPTREFGDGATMDWIADLLGRVNRFISSLTDDWDAGPDTRTLISQFGAGCPSLPSEVQVFQPNRMFP